MLSEDEYRCRQRVLFFHTISPLTRAVYFILFVFILLVLSEVCPFFLDHEMTESQVSADEDRLDENSEQMPRSTKKSLTDVSTQESRVTVEEDSFRGGSEEKKHFTGKEWTDKGLTDQASIDQALTEKEWTVISVVPRTTKPIQKAGRLKSLSFFLGSFFLSVQVILLFLLGLICASMTFCPNYCPEAFWGNFIIWTLFAFLTLRVALAAGACVNLYYALSERSASGKPHFPNTIVLIVLAVIGSLPFWFAYEAVTGLGCWLRGGRRQGNPASTVKSLDKDTMIAVEQELLYQEGSLDKGRG